MGNHFKLLLALAVSLAASHSYAALGFKTAITSTEASMWTVIEKPVENIWETLSEDFGATIKTLPGVKAVESMGEKQVQSVRNATHTQTQVNHYYMVNFHDTRVMPRAVYKVVKETAVCLQASDTCVNTQVMKIMGPIRVYHHVNEATSVQNMPKPFELHITPTKSEANTLVTLQLKFVSDDDYIQYFNGLKNKALISEIPSKHLASKTFLLLARMWAEKL